MSTTVSPSPADALPELRSLYRMMVLVRRFEERALELFAEGLITGSTHPCIGQEAIAVGACAALRPQDHVLATYRGHGVALARGSPPPGLMAELLTRETGCCKGRGGSMHLCDVSRGLLGTNAIVAAHVPIAGGVALSSKLRGDDRVTVCFFGDGASCEGEFYETLNMAALWKVPLVLICENNGFAISVPVAKSQSTPDVADRARAFAIPSSIVDGNDVLAVRGAVAEAAARARAGDGPTLVECKTVRWERHSAFSSGKPVDPEAARRWREADPIPRFAATLRALGADDLQTDHDAVEQEVGAAVQFARDSPFASSSTLSEGIFA
jgi:TPP-dependent pyruvate/acetoin dehydrogenase alpha subunit